jgi:hypothetical protein
MWLSQIQLNSNQILGVNQETRKIWISKFISRVDVSSQCNQEPLNQVLAILENFTQILPNSIEFQTLELTQI